MEIITTNEAHFIPGYTGHCPQYIYRMGDTYGGLTHKVLLDPCILHSEKLLIPNKSTDEYRVERPILDDNELVKESDPDPNVVFTYPMVPGWDAFIPNLVSKVGYRYSITGSSAISEYEKLQMHNKCEDRKLRHRTALKDGYSYPRSLGERSLFINDYRLPLETIRPEALGIHHTPTPKSDAPPHPLEQAKLAADIKPEKEADVPIPFEKIQFGDLYTKPPNSPLCDLVNNYQHRKSPEKSPITNTLAPPPSGGTDIAIAIYPKSSGMVPSYGGHVPGERFTFGQSFTKCTVDAKQCMN